MSGPCSALGSARFAQRTGTGSMTVAQSNALFAVGQFVEHRLFGYRGVVVDVDPVFSASQEWYQKVARTRPPKDEPWYHVLVHDSLGQTYVAERNLSEDSSRYPIVHPGISEHFDTFHDGAYVKNLQLN